MGRGIPWLTILSGKVAVRLANVLPLLGVWVDELHVGGEVLVTPERADGGESMVGNVGQVELVVANSQQIVCIELVEDLVGEQTIGRGGVAETGTIVEIA